MEKHIVISGDVKTNLDLYCTDYENLTVIEDFNKESHQSDMKDFCGFYKLNNLIKEPTCYKHPENSSCINLTLREKCPNREFFLVLIFPHADSVYFSRSVILINCLQSFQNWCVIETGLSDFQ